MSSVDNECWETSDPLDKAPTTQSPNMDEQVGYIQSVQFFRPWIMDISSLDKAMHKNRNPALWINLP